MAALVLWELLQPLRYQPTLGVLSCTLHADEKRARASWQPSFHHMTLAYCQADEVENLFPRLFRGWVCLLCSDPRLLPSPSQHPFPPSTFFSVLWDAEGEES